VETETDKLGGQKESLLIFNEINNILLCGLDSSIRHHQTAMFLIQGTSKSSSLVIKSKASCSQEEKSVGK
jgi:hypothetical protein